MEYLLEAVKFLKDNDFHWKDWRLSANLKITSQLKDNLIKYDDDDKFNIQFESLEKKSIDICDTIVGDTINVNFELPRNSDIFVAENIDDLITKTSILSKVSNYIIYSDNFFSWKDNVDENHKVFAYERLFDFISLCLENDVLEQHHGVNKLILFFSNSKLIIPCELNERSLDYSLGKDLDCIIKKFNSDKHKSDRVHMLRSSLYKTLKNCHENKRLVHLMNNSSNFVKLFEQNYDLFMSKFCFDSEKDKVFEAKRDFLSKLSQLLSGIQAKLLAIPLSLVLILGQMKTKPEDSPLLVNSLITLSSLVFTIIMLVLLCSQLTAISAIEQEVKSKKTRFQLELPNLYTEVKIAFDSILKQCLYNKVFIWFMLLIVIIGLLGSVITYIILTPELKEINLSTYNYITNKFNWILKISSWSSNVIKIEI